MKSRQTLYMNQGMYYTMELTLKPCLKGLLEMTFLKAREFLNFKIF